MAVLSAVVLAAVADRAMAQSSTTTVKPPAPKPEWMGIVGKLQIRSAPTSNEPNVIQQPSWPTPIPVGQLTERARQVSAAGKYPLDRDLRFVNLAPPVDAKTAAGAAKKSSRRRVLGW